MRGLLIAAPSSGAGKTTVTLGLLRALRKRGVSLASAKSGPDYIDPQFHRAALGKDCVNLDAWAMSEGQLSALASQAQSDFLIVEGAMGLFDGSAEAGSGSAADLAATLELPVLLVVDCARMSQSVAALVQGFAQYRPDVAIKGVILNNTGSARHALMIQAALEKIAMPVLGVLPRVKRLSHPSRHLGLVQAQERQDLEDFLDQAGELIAGHVDLDGILEIAGDVASKAEGQSVPPLGQRIAIARDQAFAFVYPHLLDAWQRAGAEVTFFSPLRNDAPAPNADAVYLPGGYPELHAGTLSGAAAFLAGLRYAAKAGALIYGECGGYMVLGNGLVDADGRNHKMAGLLPLETSFANPRRHLGYRLIDATNGPLRGRYRAHEFHFSEALREDGDPLFEAKDAAGKDLGRTGLIQKNVMGSYMHIIAPDAPDEFELSKAGSLP